MFNNYWLNSWNQQSSTILKLLIPFGILDLVLRGFALWRSAHKKQLYWFIALLVVNSLGILPGIYLLITNPKKQKDKKD